MAVRAGSAERTLGGRAGTAISHSLIRSGPGAIGRAAAELSRAQQEYYALAVRVRATARAWSTVWKAPGIARLITATSCCRCKQLVERVQLQYNAMQLWTDRSM